MTKLNEYRRTAAAAECLRVAQKAIRKSAVPRDVSMHRNPANGGRLFEESDLQEFLRRIDPPTRAVKPR